MSQCIAEHPSAAQIAARGEHEPTRCNEPRGHRGPHRTSFGRLFGPDACAVCATPVRWSGAFDAWQHRWTDAATEGHRATVTLASGPNVSGQTYGKGGAS